MTGYSTVLTALNNFGGRQQLPILRFHFSLISPLLRHICIDISDSIDRGPPPYICNSMCFFNKHEVYKYVEKSKFIIIHFQKSLAGHFFQISDQFMSA